MPLDPDTEARFQAFIAEPQGSRRQPQSAEERAALMQLLAQEQQRRLLEEQLRQRRLQGLGGLEGSVAPPPQQYALPKSP